MSTEMSPQSGQLIADRYELLDCVGEGGMGQVWAATDRVLGRKVALKLLRAERGDDESIARFLMEARLAAALDSPHIARVLDADASPEAPFIVMELLAGHSLREELEQGGKQPVARVCRWGLEACIGLATAHAAGIVHRDIKPSNLFVARTGEGSDVLKIVDFGIAKLQRDGLGLKTETGRILGTPGYLAPEQIRAQRAVDERVDIWALGLVLFEAVSGERAFDAGDDIEYYAMIASEAPRTLISVLPDVCPALSDAIHQCLRRAPNARFRNIAELARALAPFVADGSAMAERAEQCRAHGAPRAASVVHAGDRSKGRGQTTVEAPPSELSAAVPARRSPKPLVAIGVLGAVAVVATWLAVADESDADLVPSVASSLPSLGPPASTDGASQTKSAVASEPSARGDGPEVATKASTPTESMPNLPPAAPTSHQTAPPPAGVEAPAPSASDPWRPERGVWETDL